MLGKLTRATTLVALLGVASAMANDDANREINFPPEKTPVTLAKLAGQHQNQVYLHKNREGKVVRVDWEASVPYDGRTCTIHVTNFPPFNQLGGQDELRISCSGAGKPELEFYDKGLDGKHVTTGPASTQEYLPLSGPKNYAETVANLIDAFEP